MVDFRRRALVGFAATAWIGIKTFLSDDAASSLGQSLSPEETGRRRAIVALRVINTAEKRFSTEARASGRARYAPIPDLFPWSSRGEVASLLEDVNASAGFTVFDTSVSSTSPYLVPGFTLVTETDEEWSAYTCWLVSRTDTRTFKTDESGVIYEGHSMAAAQVEAQSHALLASAFTGQPLSVASRTSSGSARRVVEAFATMLMPVVLAQSGSYCCESMCGWECKSCGEKECNCLVDDGSCCNTGFPTCTWCCHFSCWLECSSPGCCMCTNNCF